MTITDASTGQVVAARVRIRDTNGTDHVPDSNVSVLITDDVWVAARCTEEDLLLSNDEMEAYRQDTGTFRREPCRLRFAHTSPIYVTVDGQDANVASSIAEANQMLDAFETFAIDRTDPAYLQEILDAIPENIE